MLVQQNEKNEGLCDGLGMRQESLLVPRFVGTNNSDGHFKGIFTYCSEFCRFCFRCFSAFAVFFLLLIVFASLCYFTSFLLLLLVCFVFFDSAHFLLLWLLCCFSALVASVDFCCCLVYCAAVVAVRSAVLRNSHTLVLRIYIYIYYLATQTY